MTGNVDHGGGGQVRPGDDLAVFVPGGPADLAVPPAGVHDMAQPKAPADLATNVAPADLATGTSSSCTGHVVINEVKTGGTSSVDDEFIELYNPCATSLSLAGWSVVYHAATGTSNVGIANLTGSIGGNGYYLLAHSQCACSSVEDQSYSNSLAAAGGSLGLYDAASNLVDAVGWGTAASPNTLFEGTPGDAPAAGSSLARHPNGADTNKNSVDFATTSSTTPRAANP